MKNKISSLLETPMDRQSFLKNVGLGAIMIFGVANVLDALGGMGSQNNSHAPSYGETDYGK